MPSLASIPNFNLKVCFMVHFTFIALSSMGAWSSTSYMFYNLILILFLVWSIYRPDNAEPVQLAIVVNGISIILDIMLLIMGFPSSDAAREKFSAAMCILHLICRPFSTIFLVKNLEERTGSPGALSGIFNNGEPHSSYEDIDRNREQKPAPQSGGYDFSTAQQI